ncbi:TatD family hydrolase [Pontibacillus sp. HMF3514]|uniref:TatD family hydrolase n=1 Tax=Pontibacillus sp. HMF3514 TaxID=2692425 RepID=UPI0013200F30|nr:TatD family hydrolase [Pontibacillus sp. HMF3514]QHE53369.1 TatD family deoxyribonuclease [Pontibacillus sp. HMF3514]
MKHRIIDAHIHLDMYGLEDQEKILQDLDYENVEALIAVSNHIESARRNLELAHLDQRVKPAIGWHPEQPLPSDDEADELLKMLEVHKDQIVAVGEVGLPYYMRKEHGGIELKPYLELLETFVKKAVLLDKPIVLHAIYEDADSVCDLLEKHNVKKAHFHWFKGSDQTVDRMIKNGYSISVTPDCLYEKEIHRMIEQYPVNQLMVETDGPWPFEERFKGSLTHPWMIHESIAKIAELEKMSVNDVYGVLLENTKRFYEI